MFKFAHGMHSLTEVKQESNILSKIVKDSDWLAQVEHYLETARHISFTVTSGRANCLIYCPKGN